MIRLAGDIIPSVSGAMHLGVDGGTAAGEFDHLTITPFGHIIQLSGVWLDPQYGESGIIRYSREQAAFQQSVDGGLTFTNMGAGGVDSVGVLGDADLSGDVDFASPQSGFIVIEDTANASPLLWSVNTLGLSGLWGFPANGFPSTLSRCFAVNFSSSTSVTVSHNIGTSDVQVQVFDDNSPRLWIQPDSIELTDTNTVTIGFNRPTTGRAVVIGCV